MDKKDRDYPQKSGIFTKYSDLRGMAENMPVIRKLLGLSEYGRIPTDTAIGRAVQRFVENDRSSTVCESRTD